MCIPRIHYFNPGHETAVLSGKVNYTPTRQVQTMFRDLACLPLWYADSKDLVWVEEYAMAEAYLSVLRRVFPQLPSVISTEQFLHESSLGNYEAAPWGISPQSLYYYKRLQKREKGNIRIPVWKDAYKQLTGRQTARKVLERLKELLPEMVLPVTPVFCRTVDEIKTYMQTHQPPFVLKTPFSSSGRGLLWLCSSELLQKDLLWIDRAIRKQEEISIEPALDRQQDWAMEFVSDGKGRVSYRGLSVFGTAERGAYSGNILGSESFRESFILRHISSTDFVRIKKALEIVLSEIYGYLYTGCIGVDMLLYRQSGYSSWNIHPCVEINMRQTMGMVAVQLSERFLDANATGQFVVDYARLSGEIQMRDREMQARYPLVTENGKIRSGYVSLCPITGDTHYWAYVIIS